MYKRLLLTLLLLPEMALSERLVFDLGVPLEAQQINRIDDIVFPDGTGLPPGSGTVAEGRPIYENKCAHCHGRGGQGGPNDRLVGGFVGGGGRPIKTIGSYWPYATTLFDYVRRAMPYSEPGSLTDDEVYSIVAYLLFENGIVREDAEIDSAALKDIRMPARHRFGTDLFNIP